VIEVLPRVDDYDARLDAVLEILGDVSGLPLGHLYLYDEDGGGRLHLERSREAARDDHRRVGGGPGRDDAAAPVTLFELSPEAARGEQTTPTAVGEMQPVPLDLDGLAVGMVLLGPVVRAVPARVRHQLDALRLPASVVVVQARSHEHLRRKLTALAAREDAGRKLQSSAIEVDRFIELLLDLALRATGTEAGFVAISEGDGRLEIRTSRGLPRPISEAELSPDGGLFDWAPAAEGGALILRDVETALAMGIRSLLAVPLLEGADPLGIFALVNLSEGRRFDDQSLELVEAFAEQAKLMLANARFFRSFSDRYLETVKGLARSLDVRRPHTRNHHDQVSQLAADIATAMQVPLQEVEAIRTAGAIHDVGMAAVAVTDPGGSSDMDHPSVAASLVEHLPLHPAVAGSVATHHEWFDGWGFPAGLKGDQIPLGGRILALAEFMAEMAAGDPVRPRWPTGRIQEEVEVRRGSQFDPQVADAALALLSGGELWLGEVDSKPDQEVG